MPTENISVQLAALFDAVEKILDMDGIQRLRRVCEVASIYGYVVVHFRYQLVFEIEYFVSIASVYLQSTFLSIENHPNARTFGHTAIRTEAFPCNHTFVAIV